MMFRLAYGTGDSPFPYDGAEGVHACEILLGACTRPMREVIVGCFVSRTPRRRVSLLSIMSCGRSYGIIRKEWCFRHTPDGSGGPCCSCQVGMMQTQHRIEGEALEWNVKGAGQRLSWLFLCSIAGSGRGRVDALLCEPNGRLCAAFQYVTNTKSVIITDSCLQLCPPVHSA